MVRRTVLFSILLILLCGCSESKLEEESENIEGIVKRLTSDEMTGRLTGTEGNDLAVQFIEEKYKEIGLETVQPNSYLIEYPHTFYDPEKLEFQIKITAENGEMTELQRGVDFLEKSGFTNYKGNFPLTFDINDSQLENAYIVLESSENLQQVFDKAKGILIVEELFRKTLTVDTLNKPIIQITENAYDKLKKASKVQIEVNSVAEQEIIPAFNVVGKIPGKDHTNAVVLSAHLDHVGSVNDTIYRGAIDNASGISILLDVAQKLIDANVEFEKDILIVAFNGEESGLQGSHHFIDYIKNKYENIYNINLDSIYDGPLDLVSNDEESLEELIGDLEEFFAEYDLSAKIDTSGGLTSDHSSFLNNHLNAVSIGSQNVMSKIHQPLDTAEEINYAFLKSVSEVLTQFVLKHDHKLYEHVDANVGVGMSAAEMEEFKVEREIKDAERKALQYGEYKYFKGERIQGLLENNLYQFDDLQEFNDYYPDINYKKSIGNYNLGKVVVFNRYADEIDSSNLEPNKVYKREVLLEDLYSISFYFYLLNDPAQVFNIDIEKNEGVKDDQLFEKELIINNQPYLLYFDLEQNYLYHFSFTQEKNDQMYKISIGMGEEVTLELDGRPVVGFQTTLTEQVVEEIINEYNLEEIVEETLTTL